MKTSYGCKKFNGIVTKQNKDGMQIARVRCKQWHCEYCAKQNALQWRAALLDYINNSQHKHWCFITLTVPSWVRKQSNDRLERYRLSAQVIKNGWSNFRKRLTREYGKFEFVRVCEQHKDGTMHVHMLASFIIRDCKRVVRKDKTVYSSSPTIKKHATDCGFGYIYDARNLKTDADIDSKWHAGSIAAYVTKYVTKDLKITDDERKAARIRKIQTSRGIKRVNIESDDVWVFSSGLRWQEWVDVDRAGGVVRDLSTKSIITLDDFGDFGIYPRVEDDS